MVPIVTLATSSDMMLAAENMVVMAVEMPWLGFAVVGALCHARMPRDEDVVRDGSRMTPSVFVLFLYVSLDQVEYCKESMNNLPSDIDSDA